MATEVYDDEGDCDGDGDGEDDDDDGDARMYETRLRQRHGFGTVAEVRDRSDGKNSVGLKMTLLRRCKICTVDTGVNNAKHCISSISGSGTREREAIRMKELRSAQCPLEQVENQDAACTINRGCVQRLPADVQAGTRYRKTNEVLGNCALHGVGKV